MVLNDSGTYEYPAPATAPADASREVRHLAPRTARERPGFPPAMGGLGGRACGSLEKGSPANYSICRWNYKAKEIANPA